MSSILKFLLPFIAVVWALLPTSQAADGKHLFILSGQSNMERMDPNVSFIPAVEQAFGKERVIVIKDAKGGQPIRCWYKAWKPANGRTVKGVTKNYGFLYNQLLARVKRAIEGQTLASITFVWMQGERDAKEGHGEVYAQSFEGILQQLRNDLGRDDIHFVIGRLSDMDMANKKCPHWTMVRDAQVALAESSKLASWVDTDDLPMLSDNVHHNPEGYKQLGQRFAEKAIALIQNK